MLFPLHLTTYILTIDVCIHIYSIYPLLLQVLRPQPPDLVLKLLVCGFNVCHIHTSSVPTPMLQGIHSLLMPLTFVLLAAEPSMKAVWKCTAVVSGRLSVTTLGELQKQRWSVSNWSMDMPYWQYRVLNLARDQAGSGKDSGTAMEMRPAWMIAAADVPLAPTLKMHL